MQVFVERIAWTVLKELICTYYGEGVKWLFMCGGCLFVYTMTLQCQIPKKVQKKDSIAGFFNVFVPKEAKKQVIKDELYKKLVEVGIIPDCSVEAEDNAEIEADAPSKS